MGIRCNFVKNMKGKLNKVPQIGELGNGDGDTEGGKMAKEKVQGQAGIFPHRTLVHP